MSWLYESFSVKSEKNGWIECSRKLGKWTVEVGGFYETSPYTNAMWEKTLDLIPPFDIYKNVLLLGLGAGGIIPILNERFPSAKITAVEWDPAMITLTHKLGMVKNPERIEILQQDALEAVKKINKKFDLIIVDLFKGGNLDRSVSDESFYKNIGKLLRNQGFLLVNAFREPTKITFINHFFLLKNALKFKYNYLAVFQPQLPEGYVYQREYEPFLRREEKIRKRVKVVEAGSVVGSRVSMGPIHIEHYFGDTEPQLQKGGPLRIAIWQPMNRRDRPTGWHRFWTQPNTKRMGVEDLKDGENYWEHWSDHAKRHREKWLKQDEWEIVDVGLNEFLKYYKRSKKDKILTTLYAGLIKDKVKGHGELVRLIGARRKKPGAKLEAGFACLDIPEASQSLHEISFIFKSARKSPVGVGLMDTWIKSLKEKGIRFADFGSFWAPGDPKAWFGFSKFKAQFNIRFIDYPKPLFKIVK